MPFKIKARLPYMSMRPYTEDERDTLPHIIITGDTDWDPSILDNMIDDDDEWFDTLTNFPDNVPEPLFDLQGNYRRQHAVHYVNVDSPEKWFAIQQPSLLHHL